MANSKSNIFCPNCSANNSIEQNFCRFCGINLRDTAKSLTAQLSSNEKNRQFKKLQMIKKLSDFSTTGLTITITNWFLIFAYTFLTKTVFSGQRVLFGLVIIFGVLQSVTSYLRRKNTVGYWEEITKTNSPSQNGLRTLETAKLLEDKPFASVTSVTENSTKLLFVENKTNKLE